MPAAATGIASMDGLHIPGLGRCREGNRMFAEPDAEIDLNVIEQEVLGTALGALQKHPGFCPGMHRPAVLFGSDTATVRAAGV